MKRCAVCKLDKALTEFHKAGEYLQAACKPCVIARVTKWRNENPERLAKARQASLKSAKAARQKNLVKYRAKDRAFDLKRKYGVTVEWYDATLHAQGGVCAVCATPPGRKRLAVDHNHGNGANRGLLCGLCNTALERMESIPEWHEKALAYLLKYEIAKREQEFRNG